MIFIFEDDERDILSKFFCQAYPQERVEKFVYARGNANIEDKIKLALKSTTEEVVVFMDMVPGNKEIVNNYRKYSKISKDNQYRVIILPIICAEYYVIKSLKDTIAVENLQGVDLCINRDVYFDSPIIQNELDRKFCKNFEKYCKLILIKNMKYCAKHSGKMINEYYGAYYREDCICRFCDKGCTVSKTKRKKSIEYIQQYPFVPDGSYDIGNGKLTSDEIWGIHRSLVEDYNEMSTRYREADCKNMAKYKMIKAIR